MCGLYNNNQASNIAIYKTVCLNLFIQQPALEIKAIEHIGVFDPTAPFFLLTSHETAESRAKFLYYNQYLAKVAVSYQL